MSDATAQQFSGAFGAYGANVSFGLYTNFAEASATAAKEEKRKELQLDAAMIKSITNDAEKMEKCRKLISTQLESAQGGQEIEDVDKRLRILLQLPHYNCTPLVSNLQPGHIVHFPRTVFLTNPLYAQNIASLNGSKVSDCDLYY